MLVTFADPANPGSARAVAPDDAEAVLGKGYRLQGIPPRWCRTDSGRSISAACWASPSRAELQAKLPWLNGAGNSAATALRAAGLPGVDGIDAREAFTRK